MSDKFFSVAKKHVNKEEKISAWVSAESAEAKRQSGFKSWGGWIDHLARARPGRSIASRAELDKLRMAVWAASNLDRLAKEYTSRASLRPPPAEVADAGQRAAEFIVELAAIRGQLERLTGDGTSLVGGNGNR